MKFVKKKCFLLLEMLIAMSLLAFIVSFGLGLLSNQVKNINLFQKFKENFYQEVSLKKELKEIFYHLKVDQKNYLKASNGTLHFSFDAGTFLNPAISGTQQGCLMLKKGELILEIVKGEKTVFSKVLSKDVKDFNVSFFHNKTGWKQTFDSEKQDMPEMVKIELIGKNKTHAQKFLFPSTLSVIKLTCN
jgi:hypothetical protein